MKPKKIIAGMSAFALIFAPCINYISAEEAQPIIYGDVDGDGVPQINDLTKMSLYLLQDITFNENQKKAADVNDDGKVNLPDIATMKQYIMHDDVQLGKSLHDTNNEGSFDISKCKLISENTIQKFGYELLTLDNKKQLSMVIDSENKFEEFKQLWEYNAKEAVDKLDSDLDLSKDFFKENTLFIIARQEINRNIKSSISDIKLSEERGISFEITSDISNDSNTGGLLWLHAAIIPNEYLKGINKSQIRITNTGNAIENDSVINLLNISYCDILNYKTSYYFDFLPADDKKFEMSAVIKSDEDFKNYNKKFNNSADKLGSYYGMSKEFFKNNTLFIIPVIESSGSIKDEITSIRINSNKEVSIGFTSSVPATGQCDMATWHLAIAVPNNFIKGIDTSEFEVTRTVKQQKVIADNDVLDLSDCENIDLPSPYDISDLGFHSSLITSEEELYKYNNLIKLTYDLVRPQHYNYAGLLNDNIIVSIDDIGHSGTLKKYISEISVDENNKISVGFTTYTSSSTLTADARMTHTCLLIPRKYLSKSSAEPTLEVIKHRVNDY